MKKLLLFLCLLPLSVWAQTPHGNGAYRIKLPSDIYSSDLAWKRALLEDDSSMLWIGFAYHVNNQGQVGLGKLSNGNWTMYRTSNSGLLSNKITDLAAGDTSDILIATHGGLSIYNRKHQSWTGITTSNSALPSNLVNCISKVGSTIWLGTSDGLVKWEQGNMTIFNAQDWGTGTSEVRHLVVSGNTVFVGTSEGLLEYKNGTWKHHQYQGADFQVNRLCMAPQDELYIYGDSGLYIFTNGLIRAFSFNMDCTYHLKNEDLEKGNGLTIDPSGNLYFIPRSNPGNSGYYHDLYLYQIKDDEVKEMAYLGIPTTYGRDQFLVGTASGNIWVLDGNTDSITLIKPWEYKERRSPMLSQGRNFNRLDINKMDLGILNRGDMFWDLYERPAMEIPKGSCKNAAFAASLWIGGVDMGQNLHIAAQTYRQSGTDYYPGPLDTVTLKGSTDENNPYNRIWKINRREILEFQKAFSNGALSNGTFVPSPDFLEWPAHGTGNYSRNLAPFVDVNLDGTYDPCDGDYPKIRGDQMLFWIFNDNSNIHTETGGLPLGLEIHASAYAYNCNSIQDGDSDEVLNYTAFYHYKIINRSNNGYTNMYYGKWMDVDLGNYVDDRIGCSPEGNFMYGYNGDNDDEGPMGYGNNPPMINVLWLNDTMKHFMYYGNDYSILGNPVAAEHYYGYMKALWKDGSPVTEGGNGYQTGGPGDYMFPGNPYDTTEWNESSGSMLKGDRRMISSVHDNELQAGGVKELEYAIIYTREPNAPNGLTTSWAKNLADIDRIKHWYHTNSFPTCDGVGSSTGDEIRVNEHLSLYPNPGTSTFSIQLAGQPLAGAEVKVVDVTGRQIYGSQATNGVIDASAWKAGIYFIRVVRGGVRYSAKWVKVE